MISTCQGRLLSVGLADLRGAMHLGFDEASWMGTAFNAAMMFIGPFSVYLGGLLGPRRVLLSAAVMFTVLMLVLPLVHGLTPVLIMLVLAGLTAGTFYPLTLSFVLRSLPMRYILLGIAMYAIDIVFTTDASTALEAFYMDHFSWRWIFWNGALLTPLMIALLHYGMPHQPLPEADPGKPRVNWRGFLYASLGAALIYIALDQGQRLNWFHSGTIVACFVSGAFLAGAAAVRHFVLPNPLINFQFLWRRNTLLLSLVLVSFRFVMLATVVSIPNFLGSIQGYLPLQTGRVLLWVGLPQFLLGLGAMALMRWVDPRLLLGAGFGLVGLACVMNAQLTSVWSGSSFVMTQVVMAVGLPLAFNAMVGSLILELINTGALKRPIDTLTFAGYFQTVRLMGGELGATMMGRFLSVREQFHSNILGLGVNSGSSITVHRLLALRAGILSQSAGTATARAGVLLAAEVKKQALTLAVADSFALIACCCVVCLVAVSAMAKVPVPYRKVIAADAKAA
ncbi:MFS transporter [Silvibacterium dinghuense]|uniref:MFS transporter n=2 Tax=Silvibacterium dinghuense TaxID=1560006 RepID=A0A4Q1SEM7_9BACT|nr:MFS transporter [Silvibacterium dinghuense]